MNQNPKLSSIMIVGSEVGSVYFDCAKDPYDISQLINYVQMGDGAATALITANDHSQTQIISDIFLGHIGLDKDSGFYLEGGSRKPSCPDNHTTQPFFHKTNQVFTHGAELFLKGLDAIYKRGYQLEHFNYIIPHQANGYMAKYLSHALDIPEEKIILHANKVGNMGSAAIWYSLDQLLKSNRLSQGDKVLVLGAEATKYLYGGFVYQH
ncbi:hypothetical protein L3V83_13930 [Thiotrichales bacterium 19X7-9]|nr:hypothetical protein [Thiotrichales bacterium 19X7-9]